MIPLAEAADPLVFGRKAVALGAAARAGLPVPGGVALSVDAVEAVVRADPEMVTALHRVCADGGPRAVRSSAVREDSAGASFAGAYCTVLGVCDPDAVAAAVRRVHASKDAPAARAYRAQLRLRRSGMGVVIQELVPAEVAGVLFTRNPVTGAAERVIEASWGLGESVVAGLVIPDRYRLDARGRVLERTTGVKDVALRMHSVRPVRGRAPSTPRTCTRPASTTCSSPRCTLSRRPATPSTAPGTTTSSSRSTPARCSCCSGGRSPVGETGRRAGSGAARLLADAAQLHDDRGGAARDRPRVRPLAGHRGAGGGGELSRGGDRAAEPGRQAGRPCSGTGACWRSGRC